MIAHSTQTGERDFENIDSTSAKSETEELRSGEMVLCSYAETMYALQKKQMLILRSIRSRSNSSIVSSSPLSPFLYVQYRLPFLTRASTFQVSADREKDMKERERWSAWKHNRKESNDSKENDNALTSVLDLQSQTRRHSIVCSTYASKQVSAPDQTRSNTIR